MTYKISFPKCFLCGTKEEVYQCQVCYMFACATCTNYSDGEHCQHELKTQSEVSKWTSRASEASR